MPYMPTIHNRLGLALDEARRAAHFSPTDVFYILCTRSVGLGVRFHVSRSTNTFVGRLIAMATDDNDVYFPLRDSR